MFRPKYTHKTFTNKAVNFDCFFCMYFCANKSADFIQNFSATLLKMRLSVKKRIFGVNIDEDEKTQ